MNALILVSVLVAVVMLVMAVWPMISNTMTGSGRWFRSVPAAVMCLFLAVLAAQRWGWLSWEVGLLVLFAVALLIDAMITWHQAKKLRLSDD